MDFFRPCGKLKTDGKRYEIEAGKGVHVDNGERVEVLSGFTFSERPKETRAILAEQEIALEKAKIAEEKTKETLAEIKRISTVVENIFVQLKECKNLGTMESDFAKSLKKDLVEHGKHQRVLFDSILSNSRASSSAAPSGETAERGELPPAVRCHP